MAFCLSARWPNGTYLGHAADGTPEALPSFARAYSALIHAGGTGSLASTEPGDAAPGFARLTPETVAALRWLENHAPTGMEIPAYPDHIPARRTAVEGYRPEGVFQKEGTKVVYKKGRRRIGEASWISAPIRWFWDEEPPAEIAAHIDALCADVATLGEADSPAILETATGQDPAARTHDLRVTDFFDTSPHGEVHVPAPGRLDALEEQFVTANPSKRPTPAQDKPVLSQAGLPRSEKPARRGLQTVRLVPRDTAVGEVPWSLAVVLPVVSGPTVPDADRVRVAVALHRALIACIGQDCPPVVTGRYGTVGTPPANRVALHYLPAGLPLREADRSRAHVVVLLPRDITVQDANLVHSGLARLRELRTRQGVFELDAPSVLPGDALWEPVPDGRTREWETSPAAIPERIVKAHGAEQILIETVAWSLGNVLRDLVPEGPGTTPADRWDWARAHGGDVTEIAPLWVNDPRAYVHHTKRAIPVMPYRARLTLGDLVPDTAAVALGQSRHLGGGLLVPIDRRVREESPHV